MPETVHLINPMHSATGGSEWHTLSLFEILATYTDVNIWTEFKPDPQFTGRCPIRTIETHRGVFPKGGNLVFVGVYFGVSGWIRAAKPKRTIVFFNTPDLDRLRPFVAALQEAGCENVEVVYQSEAHRDHFPDLPGPVHSSPIDLGLFQPQLQEHEGFVVGRYSRDMPEKHHADDADLYRRLAEAGCKVQIMGGRSQKEKVADDRVELTEAGTIPPWEFLQHLDCFLYRVREDLFEAFGRVVAEAMACGVPVVAENRGGYVSFVSNGENGFLFASNEEAVTQVLRLREDPELRVRISQAARQTMVDLYSPASQAEMAEFYYR